MENESTHDHEIAMSDCPFVFKGFSLVLNWYILILCDTRSDTREYWRWTGSNMRCGTWLAWPYKDLHGMFAAGVQTNLTLNSFLNGRSLLNNVVCDLESSLLS